MKRNNCLAWFTIACSTFFAASVHGADFTVDAARDVKPISRYIYGVNQSLKGAYSQAAFIRLGGNRWTAYNWVNNASNAGRDFHFESDSYLGGGDRPGGAVMDTLDDAYTHHAAVLLTVPINGYVAADKPGGGDIRKGDPNYLQDHFRPEQPKKDSAFTLNPDPKTPVVYEDEFVNWVRAKYPWGHTDSDRPIFFSLDNEPALWSRTHREVHPKKTTYAELIEKGKDYAAAIKDVFPEALVFGPVNYGWNAYVNLNRAPDANGRDFQEVYLAAMKQAERESGRRLLDVLDVHWYSEARGGRIRVTQASTQPVVADARVQAPRSLWDPNYVEQSWIADSLGRRPIHLIPRLFDKIARNYPGTKLAFTEYNYGGGADISGAIAEADVLGIFGREGVFAAAEWPSNPDESFIAAAFSMFRNFDSNGGQFGDTSVYAHTDDAAASSLYASIDSKNPDEMVLVAINKTTQPMLANVHIRNAKAFTHSQIYQLLGKTAGAQLAETIALNDSTLLKLELPPRSVSTILLTIRTFTTPKT